MAQERNIDWFMFGIAAMLALFGAMMVYSASAMFSLKETDSVSQNTYFYKQIGFTLIGLVAMYVVSRIDYHFFEKSWVVYCGLTLTCILLLAVFGFPEINGARRWIRIAGFSFQPSELAKLALPIFLAYYLTKKEDVVGSIRETVLPCLLGLGLLGGLCSLKKILVLRSSYVRYFRRFILQPERDLSTLERSRELWSWAGRWLFCLLRFGCSE
ncbi:MAG: FtsW/RodA/SpoVE family cell cycle protein [Chloracidobacterium sp.]|nr:FtsW/RodA/SpoVE family cell cycle protein [Chloracidobacterium sp.]